MEDDSDEEGKKKRRRKHFVIRKSFELDDFELISKSRMWHQLYGNHLADFQNFDPMFDAAFADVWLQKIEDFVAHPTDEVTLDELQEHTNSLEQKTNVVFALLSDLEYYTGKAFPDDKRKLMEFGFDAIQRLRKSNFSSMVVRCIVALRVLDSYHTELLAAGLPPAFMTDYDTATDKLATAEVNQEYFKTIRIKRTTERVKLFNGLYAIHIVVQKAANNVFRDNAVVARQFGL